jgi:hypothetical protein
VGYRGVCWDLLPRGHLNRRKERERERRKSIFIYIRSLNTPRWYLATLSYLPSPHILLLSSLCFCFWEVYCDF